MIQDGQAVVITAVAVEQALYTPLMVQRSTYAGMTVGHRFFLCVNESGLA